MYVHMTKIISLSDEAYERLARLKNGSSFSQTVIRLTVKTREKNLLEVINKMGKNDVLASSIEKIYKNRKKMFLKKVDLK